MLSHNNKQLGSAFEVQFCDALARNRFWVHFISQNKSGQPADIIAVKNKKAFLIDCKVCTNGYFLTSRVEVNQELAMNRWEHICGNGTGWFALKLPDTVYMLAFAHIDLTKKRVGLDDAILLEEWIKHASTD